MKNDLPVDYEVFQQTVADLLYDGSNFNFLGAGADSRVYRIDLPMGSFAVKIAKEGALNSRGRVMCRSMMTSSNINSGIRGLGVPGIEQIVSGSVDNYIAIYNIAKGNILSRVTDDYLDYVTAEQKEALYETVKIATDKGLAFDGYNPSGANAFYDMDEGFTLIDYRIPYWNMTFSENWSAAMRSLGPVALRAFAPRF